MAFLKISGINVSDYIKTLSISHEPVWNSKAGRTLTADFVGRVIARKWKLQCTTRPLSQTEMQMITNLLEEADFFNVEFIPTNATSAVTKTFYVNAPSTKVYTYSEKLPNVRYESLSFNIIQQ
jgi:hypothetical protein